VWDSALLYKDQLAMNQYYTEHLIAGRHGIYLAQAGGAGHLIA